ncbi:MAG TPA: trigger factor [Anaerolineales bacterium]|jgi:trigger factor|nr:trigger factor [Anaerolineales bacterium]
MTLKIDKTYEENHEARLVVEVEPEKMDTYKRRAARQISQRGKIAGFRPGKAPYDMVVRTYGEQPVIEQAMDLFVDAEYSNILKEAGVEPGAAGSLESIDSLEPPRLTFKVPLAPEVDLGDYRSIRMPYEWTAPDEQAIDAAVEDLRQMYATTENVEREAQEGDYVLVDVKSETTELNRTGFAAMIRNEDRDNEWPFSGFARQLIGLKPGDTKTITHTFPEDWDVEDLRGKDVEMEVTVKTVRAVSLPELDDEFAKTTGTGETLEELRETVKKDVEARSKADYDDKYFVDLIEKIKEGASLKYHQHALEHEEEHVLEDLSQRLAQQGMDLDTYFKVRNTTREQFIEEEVKPVAKKRFERSLILDEIVRREKIEVDNTALDEEFNQTLSALTMQGVDLSKIRGGRRGQQRVAQAVAMESANRILTRSALDTLKSIATGEYIPPEERQQAEERVTESLESESMDAETEEAASPREKQEENTPPETQALIEPTNEDVEEDANEATEPVVGDTSVSPDPKSE